MGFADRRYLLWLILLFLLASSACGSGSASRARTVGMTPSPLGASGDVASEPVQISPAVDVGKVQNPFTVSTSGGVVVAGGSVR